MQDASQDRTAAMAVGALVELQEEIRELAGRLDALESQMVVDRALHRRVAELADVVEQLFLTSDRQPDQGLVGRVRRYVKSL